MDPGDGELVGRAQGGDLRAFDDLMRRYERLVCSIALGYVADRDDALDVTQNVFVKVYDHLDDVVEPGMFKPWLLRITSNESINWWRRTRRREAREVPGQEVDDISDPAGPGEERLDAGRRRSTVARSLHALGPKYRIALALRYAEGLRIREIARAMDCSEGMVKSLLFRGVRRLRRNVAGAE